MKPRPILKVPPEFQPELLSPSAAALPFASCYKVVDDNHVHFPPTPILTTTQITHSASAYDRAPIVVSPNSCALPKRGGRVYRTQHGPNTRVCSMDSNHAQFNNEDHEPPSSTSPPYEPPPLLFCGLSPPYNPLFSEQEDQDAYHTNWQQAAGTLPAFTFSCHTFDTPTVPMIPAPTERMETNVVNTQSRRAINTQCTPGDAMITKPKRRRSNDSSPHPNADTLRRLQSSMPSAFAEPSLDDGCLGGF